MQRDEFRYTKVWITPDGRVIWYAVLGGSIVLLVAILDLSTANFNPAIGYVLPVIIGARARRTVRWPLTALLIVLLYAGYFLGPKANSDQDDWHAMIYNYRMVNRTMAALVILLASGISAVATMVRRHVVEEVYLRLETGEEIFLIIDKLIVGFVCVILVFGILLIDLTSPTPLNPSLLYAVPILLARWTASRRFLWFVTVTAVFAAVGGFLGDPHLAESGHVSRLATNRGLAIVAALMAAVTQHLRVPAGPS